MAISIGAALITGDKEIDSLKQLLHQLSKFDQVVIGYNGTDPKVKEYLSELEEPYEVIEFEWRPSAKKPRPESPEVIDPRRFETFTAVYDEYYPLNEWGFSYARNLTWEKLTTTHAIWIDSDDLIGFVKNNKEVIVTADQAYKAFRKIALEAPDDVNVWFSTYVYSRDQYNNPVMVYTRERLIKNPSEWKWVYPIHEVLVPPEPPKWAAISDVQYIHYPKSKLENAAERNQRMLKEWIEQLEALDGSRHDKGRALWYLADTYWAIKEYKTSAQLFVQFVRDFPDALDIERWQAWIYAAKCQIELNNFQAASAAALASIEIEPGFCDGYILLAQCKLLTDQDPQDILVLLETAGHLEEPPAQVIQNPLDYSYTIYSITSKCKYLLGQYDSALEWALKACKVCPDDDRAEWLRVEAAAKVRERDAVESAKALYQLYLDYDENEKADKLYETLPYIAQENEDVKELALAAKNRVRHISSHDEYIALYDTKEGLSSLEAELDADFIPHPERFEYITERIKNSVPEGGLILDVGSARGFYSLNWASMGYKVVGIDINSSEVEEANRVAETRNLTAKFVPGMFEDMNPEMTLDPFTERPEEGWTSETFKAASWYQHFDAVIAGEILEHVQNPDLFMGYLIDCAKPGAPVIITTPDEAFEKGDSPRAVNMKSTDTLRHLRAYTQERFEAFLKKDPETHVTESHYLPMIDGYRFHQGWQVGEVKRIKRPDGPIIRIYCGPNIRFSPEMLHNPKEEIAGSEMAVIYTARELAKLDCQVVVYSGVSGIYDGVFYRKASSFDYQHYSDVFIAWRIPTAFMDQRPNAKLTFLWTHDLFYQIQIPGHGPNEIPQEWVDRIDKVMVLSRFHDEFVRGTHKNFEGKTWITRNGLNPEEYLNRDIEKIPHRYFYSSDWGRGIDELLEVWPKIKSEIPDAELHIAYSFGLVQRWWKQINDQKRLREIEKIYRMVQEMPGVVYHDRLGHKELAELQLTCEAWLYPPNPFLETYCMTALEAQAAGCIPISRRNGALAETIKAGYDWERLDDPNLIQTLKTINIKDNPYGIKKAREWAMAQTWENLAKEWLIYFHDLTEEKDNGN